MLNGAIDPHPFSLRISHHFRITVAVFLLDHWTSIKPAFPKSLKPTSKWFLSKDLIRESSLGRIAKTTRGSQPPGFGLGGGRHGKVTESQTCPHRWAIRGPYVGLLALIELADLHLLGEGATQPLGQHQQIGLQEPQSQEPDKIGATPTGLECAGLPCI